MLGAIAGDVIGSVHEFSRTKTTDFELFVAESSFTDDTVLAVAVAEAHDGRVPPHIASEAIARLDGRLRAVVTRFRDRFMTS